MWISVDEAVGDDVIPAGRGSVGGMWELATWAEVDCRGELKGSAGISLSLGFPGWLRFYRRVAPTHSPLTAHSQPTHSPTLTLRLPCTGPGSSGWRIWTSSTPS